MSGERGMLKRSGKHLFRLEIMPECCRVQARSFRRDGREADARSLEAQAERWQHEIDTGEPAIAGRIRIGEWEPR